MHSKHILIAINVFFAVGCGQQTMEETHPVQSTDAALVSLKGDSCSVKVGDIEFTRALNGADKNAKVDNGKLSLSSDAKKDYFTDPDGKLSNNTAPVLMTELDNTKPFTFIAKVTPAFNETYDACALYIFSSDSLWQKFAFERDERKKSRIVSVRTIGTSDDNNHDIVNAPSVYLKISSDGTTIGFYYSIDKTNWQLARLYKNEFPAKVGVGISTQSPVGNGTTGLFEDISLTTESVKDFRMGV